MRMASALSLLPLLPVVLAAQTVPASYVSGSGGLGITIKVLPPDQDAHQPLRYVLSEPGYVAAFIIYPGAGVRLLYPAVDAAEKIEYAGYHTDQLIGASFDNDVYHAVLGSVSPSGPAYLYVIASRHPLDVARYVHRPMRLASAVGEKESRSFYADVQFDALLNNAIALGDDYSWDSDVYMLWPNSTPGTGYADGRTWDGVAEPLYTYVYCTDGSTRLVPINYPFQGCPGQSQIRANVAPRAQLSASAATGFSNGHDVATVLPTIVGKPVTAAEHRAALRDGQMQRAPTMEVANGQPNVVSPSAAQQSGAVELETIAVTPLRTHNAEIANSPQFRPQLAPNPTLAPDPELAPNPGFPNRAGSQANREDAAQFERQDRQMRSSRSEPDQAQSRQQFNQQRQEQAGQTPEPRAEPARSAPPPVKPAPMALAPRGGPSRGGRAAA